MSGEEDDCFDFKNVKEIGAILCEEIENHDILTVLSNQDNYFLDFSNNKIVTSFGWVKLAYGLLNNNSITGMKTEGTNISWQDKDTLDNLVELNRDSKNYKNDSHNKMLLYYSKLLCLCRPLIYSGVASIIGSAIHALYHGPSRYTGLCAGSLFGVSLLSSRILSDNEISTGVIAGSALTALAYIIKACLLDAGNGIQIN